MFRQHQPDVTLMDFRNYSSLYSLPLRSLRPLRLNHSDATGNDIIRPIDRRW